MDVREFIRKQESALKRYRRIYKLLDFLIIMVLAYTLMLLLSIDQILPLVDGFDVYIGTNYNLAGINIPFENFIITIIAAFFSLILTLLLHIRDKKTATIIQIEEKYPDLRERLRTAYDNINVENIIVDDLEEKVSVRVSQVDPLVLLSKNLLLIGVIGLLFSSISVTYVTVYDVHILQIGTDKWKDIIDDLPFIPDESNSDGLFILDEEDGDQDADPGDEDLTGEPAVIVV
ncbi:MAG: hypothetical protein JW705_04705, partial [Methanosarcinaceae archaeon]|nr:hypothetical protein [Methanosarcinaceae archaeon]